MRRRKWLWMGFAALCAFAVVVGYLARPEDDFEVAALRAIHPKHEEVQTRDGLRSWSMEFDLPAAEIQRRASFLHGIPVTRSGGLGGLIFFPKPIGTGLLCAIEDYPAERRSRVRITEGLPLPWFTRSWFTLKYRLGLY
jgi:hypothetical protein